MKKKQLIQKAKDRLNQLNQLRNTEKFRLVMGIFVKEKMLIAPHIAPFKGKLYLPDVFWAAAIEPRIYEILPAALLKRPGLFTGTQLIPEDLKKIIKDLRKGTPTKPFHDIPAKNYAKWLPVFGYGRGKNRLPSRYQGFRLTAQDLLILQQLKKQTNFTESALIRMALRLLKKSMPL